MSSLLKAEDFIHSAPLIFLIFWSCLVLLADALGESKSSRLGPLAILGLVLDFSFCLWSWAQHPTSVMAFGEMLLIDRYALFLDMLFLLSGILSLLLSGPFLQEHRFGEGEYYSLVSLALIGMMLLVHAGNWIVLIIGLEIMSISLYALAAFWHTNRESVEAGLKYFIMGAVASAFLLYGVALLYGSAGTINLSQLATRGSQLAAHPIYVLGMLMVLTAMGFKVALVPFHAWAPDVYEGSPTPVTGLMATAVKAAGFGALLRIFTEVFGADLLVFGRAGWGNIFWTLSILTMTIGNITALRQSSIKRMLAFSSIGHAGTLLIGVIASGIHPQTGTAPLLYYLLAYTVTTIGAFGMIVWIGSWNDERLEIDDWAGLASRHPLAALAMTLFLLSLGGIPPTAGFFAKFYLFQATLSVAGKATGLVILVVIAALNSVVSIYYYLKPVVVMYFFERSHPPAPLRSGSAITALAIAALLVLILGVLPGKSLEWAGQSLMVTWINGR